MAQNFSEFFFFNQVGKLNQENFPKYMEPFFPDGVVKGVSQELQVYGNSTGMKVMVKPGICYVHTHRASNPTAETELPIDAADPTYSRIDLVVARAVYDIAPNSYMCLAIKKGAASANPAPPLIEKTAGVLWEVPLAEVLVGAGVQTISGGAVTDKRIWSVLPVERGGTNAPVASGALANIFEGGVLSMAKGGTGSNTPVGARTNLGLGNASVKNIGEATVTANWTGGTSGSIAVPGLPAGGLVFIEPVDASRAAFYAVDTRYMLHGAGTLSCRFNAAPGSIQIVVGWIG